MDEKFLDRLSVNVNSGFDAFIQNLCAELYGELEKFVDRLDHQSRGMDVHFHHCLCPIALFDLILTDDFRSLIAYVSIRFFHSLDHLAMKGLFMGHICQILLCGLLQQSLINDCPLLKPYDLLCLAMCDQVLCFFDKV